MILAIETSQQLCTVALFDGPQLLGSFKSDETMAHNRILLSGIIQCLQMAQVEKSSLSAVAFSAGPGSYTGLRVGSSTAKGLCFALNIPLIAVSTFQIIAEAARKVAMADIYISMIDARRMEVYQQYLDVNLNPISEPEAWIVREDYFDHLRSGFSYVCCGNGAFKVQSIPPQVQIAKDILPSAENMGTFAYQKFSRKEFENIFDYQPFYLKEFGQKAHNQTS